MQQRIQTMAIQPSAQRTALQQIVVKLTYYVLSTYLILQPVADAYRMFTFPVVRKINYTAILSDRMVRSGPSRSEKYTGPSQHPAPKHQSVAWCSLFTLFVVKRTRRCMACLEQIAHRHRRLGALAPKAWVIASACMVHCQLPGTKASRRADCSAFQEARGHIDAWPI